jgi:hypothetical protein
MFCQYRDIFGKSNEGIHAYRIPFVNLAAVDVIMTFVLGIIVWFATSKVYFSYIMLLLLIIGIISHKLFCVRTTIDKFLFPEIENIENIENFSYNE